MAALFFSVCAELRDAGCGTVESACRQTCRAGDIAQQRSCDDRCAAQNPCRKG